ncbi:MAG TPA: DUF4245 domain-containing protein [Dermatophilaceae bacterium]|nr:DUF4245 domain-containing protein [Dermatophilaceae bacterium]
MSTATPPQLRPQTGGPRQSRRRGLGTVKNMVISLLLVIGFVVVWLAMVPRVSQVNQPPVDVTSVARQVARDTGWAIAQPALPSGWRATSVRFVRSTDGLMTWHAGYLSPEQEYVALEQTRGATSLWVETQTNRGRVIGTVQVAGRPFQQVNRLDKVQRSLVSRGAGPTDLTTVVTGTATFDELAQFAALLRPVQPAR